VTEFQSRLNQLNYTKQEFSDREEESQTETPIKFASPPQRGLSLKHERPSMDEDI